MEFLLQQAELTQAPGVGRTMLSLKALWENSSLLLLAFGVCLKSLALLGLQLYPFYFCLCLHGFLPCVFKFPSSYKASTRYIGVHSHSVQFHLNLITSTKLLFPNKVTFTGTRVGIRIYIGGRCKSIHNGICIHHIKINN